jgi:excisionase family DNA binding protein
MAPVSPPPDSSALGRFLTLADTAEVLNISASQAYALVRSGELPAIKIGGSGHGVGGRGGGGQRRVERDVLEGYIAGKYEENRRRNLWNQAEFADIPELFADRER